MSYDVCVLDDISQQGLKLFSSDHFQIAPAHDDPHLLLVRSTSIHEHNFGEQLLAVGRAGAGINNIPVDTLTERGVVVFNTPGANANAVKELVICGMLMASRNIAPAFQYMTQASSTGGHAMSSMEKQKKQFIGGEIAGKTLGVIGLGNIGVQVANTALSMGMHVVGYDPVISVQNSWQLSANVQRATELGQLLSRCDFISLHIPLNEKTENLIDQAAFNALKPNAVLLNFARPKIVDLQALLAALDNQQLAGYVTDFPEAELASRQNVIALPHLGASTVEAKENCARMLVQQMVDYVQHGAVKNAVNLPDIDTLAPVGHRLAVINKNVPHMVSQISSAVSNASLNIVDLINRSKGDYAYTLLDVDGDFSPNIIDIIEQIEGVVRVRQIS